MIPTVAPSIVAARRHAGTPAPALACCIASCIACMRGCPSNCADSNRAARERPADRAGRGGIRPGSIGGAAHLRHGPVGAFVGAEDDCGPAVTGALMNLLQGHAVLSADGAKPGAECHGVTRGASFSVSLFGEVVDGQVMRSVIGVCPDSALLGGFVATFRPGNPPFRGRVGHSNRTNPARSTRWWHASGAAVPGTAREGHRAASPTAFPADTPWAPAFRCGHPARAARPRSPNDRA